MKNAASLLVPGLILCLGLLVPGCKKSSSHGFGVVNVAAVGDMTADPIRECVYVSDVEAGQVITLSTRTGNVSNQWEFMTKVSGLTLDACAEFLYVGLPDAFRIDVLRLADGVIVEQIAVGASPLTLEWLDEDHLLMVTDRGLLEWEFSSASSKLVFDTKDYEALLDVSGDQMFAYLGYREDDVTSLVRINLETDVARPIFLPAGTLEGILVGLQLSYDDSILYTATTEGPGLVLVDTGPLQLIRTVDVGSGLTSFALNPTTTRLYLSRGSSLIESMNLHNFGAGRDILAGEVVRERGLTVAPNGLSLVTHEANGDVQSYLAFDARLEAPTAARLGSTWEMNLTGPPDEFFIVYASRDPGYQFLDPETDFDPRFVDLDPATTIVLAFGKLDPAGAFQATYQVNDLDRLEDIEVILQMVTLTATTFDFHQVSNPLLVHVLPRSCN